VRGTLQRVRALDAAWNARAWQRYAALLDEDLEAFAGGETQPHGKAAHLDRAQAFCAAFPDAERRIEPYLDLFASADGARSLSVAMLSGTAAGVFDLPVALPRIPQAARFDITVLVICRWRFGRVVHLREHFDHLLWFRQLGRVSLSSHPRSNP